MSPSDLAELLGAFNEASTKLQASHEALSAEVARLQRELSQANEQLERSRRLAALGEMAAGIAHEIRNPLGSIRLYSRMLEDDLAKAGRDAEVSLAQRIAGAVRTVDAVVRDVLAFAGDARIRPETVDLDDLFTRAIDESLAANPMDVRVVRRDRDDAPAQIRGDAALLHRALVNVISNALQAMHEAPDLAQQRARELVTGASQRAVTDAHGARRGFVALTITDSGPGIPPQVMTRVFNPFFTTRATGTGLGLAIVHRIVDAHGGSITVRNVERGGGIRGAEVEILLPSLSAPEETQTPEQRPMAATATGITTRHRRRPAAATARPAPFRVTEDAS